MRTKLLAVVAAALFLPTAALADPAPCCASARKKGESCAHTCCAKAAKEGKECTKCGGAGKAPKDAPKADPNEAHH